MRESQVIVLPCLPVLRSISTTSRHVFGSPQTNMTFYGSFMLATCHDTVNCRITQKHPAQHNATQPNWTELNWTEPKQNRTRHMRLWQALGVETSTYRDLWHDPSEKTTYKPLYIYIHIEIPEYGPARYAIMQKGGGLRAVNHWELKLLSTIVSF